MAKAKKEENNNGNQTDASKNFLRSLMGGYKEDTYNHIDEKPFRFSTGSLLLDTVLSQNSPATQKILGSGPLVSGSVLRLSGAFLSGKSSQAILLAYNYMQESPKSKTIYVKAEGRLSENLIHRTGMKFVYSAEEWDYGTIFVLETNKFEPMADILENMLKTMHQNGEKLFCIIDSLDGLILTDDAAKNIKESGVVAGVPKITKLFFRRMALPINKYNAFFVLISGVSSEIKLNPYSKEPPRPVNGSGGASAAHAADVILEYNPRYNGDLILQNPKEKPSIENKVLGHEVSLKVIKSTNESDSMICRIPIKRGRIGTPNSIWVEKEILDYCLAFEILKKKGAWVSFDQSLIDEAKSIGIELKEQFQGLEAVYSYIEENKSVFDWLYSKFKKILTQ